MTKQEIILRDKNIIALYQEGKTLAEIAEEMCCCYTTVFLRLKKYNIPMRTTPKCKEIPKDIENLVLKEYKNKTVYAMCCEHKELNQALVNKILKKHNVQPISRGKRNSPNLKEDYFERIDTPNKAYWLGWLITDGCITSRHDIEISLQARDVPILELFASDLGVYNKIKDFNKIYKRFLITNKIMCEHLAQYGVIPNKTFTVDFPQLADELLPSFLRGCFEGDGHIGRSFHKRSKKLCYELSFTGNKQMVEGFNKAVSFLCNLKPKNVITNRSIWRVRWSCKDEIIKIMEMMYRNSETHRLERKYSYLAELRKNE